MTCMKQEFCIHEKYCQRHIGQNFDSCILFSRNSKPMTNEEWLKSMTTEEFAEWIYRAMFYKSCQKDVEDGAYMQMMTKKDYIESWLMEKHDEM